MQKVLHIRTTVQPGGRVEIMPARKLDRAGQTVDVVVTSLPRPTPNGDP